MQGNPNESHRHLFFINRPFYYHFKYHSLYLEPLFAVEVKALIKLNHLNYSLKYWSH